MTRDAYVRGALAAAKFLAASGRTAVHNVRGGIAAWSDEVDPSLPA